MDKRTIRAYDLSADQIAAFHSSMAPTRLYNLALKYFLQQGLTLDLGCGIGRDCEWLLSQGFPVANVPVATGSPWITAYVCIADEGQILWTQDDT